MSSIWFVRQMPSQISLDSTGTVPLAANFSIRTSSADKTLAAAIKRYSALIAPAPSAVEQGG